MSSLTYYEVLGVAPDSSLEEIKVAFHTLARACHPDRTSSAGNNSTNDEDMEQFRRIQQAWEVLGDSSRRIKYNNKLQQEAMIQKAKRSGVVPLQWDEDAIEEALDDETGEAIYVYDCRCGDEVVFVTEEGKSATAECPGCCFVYQVPERPPSS